MADEKNRRSEDEPARQGDVLGLSDTPVASGEDDEVRAMAPEPDADPEGRRRRADDIAERDAAPRDPVGGPEPPPGLHVEN
jgi:hypothetical protein